MDVQYLVEHRFLLEYRLDRNHDRVYLDVLLPQLTKYVIKRTRRDGWM